MQGGGGLTTTIDSGDTWKLRVAQALPLPKRNGNDHARLRLMLMAQALREQVRPIKSLIGQVQTHLQGIMTLLGMDRP